MHTEYCSYHKFKESIHTYSVRSGKAELKQICFVFVTFDPFCASKVYDVCTGRVF